VRLIPRLSLVIGVAFLVPIAALGYGVQHAATKQVAAEVSEKQSQFADGLALYVQTWLESDVRLAKQLARGFALDALDSEQQRGFVRLVLQQVPGARIAALVDVSGNAVVAERGPIDATEAQQAQFLERLPRAELRAALAEGNDVVVGRPYLPEGGTVPAFAIAVQASPALVLGVEIGLGSVADRFRDQALQGQDLTLLDDEGDVVVAGEGGLVNPVYFKALTAVGADHCADNVRYFAPNGVDVIAACAFVAGPRWIVALAEPTETTIAATERQIVGTTVFLAAWGAFFAVVIVVVFGRQFVRPVMALKDAALTVADGQLGAQVERPATDEIVEMGELSNAFNYMSARLQQNRETIEEKNAEIEAFNVELQKRLDERTKELEEAQVLLIRSARLSAVGQMGAGLAHELNNPLAGILGMVQVVLTKRRGQPDEALLRVIEEQAQRCSQIVAHLLRFSRPETLAPGALGRDADRVDLREVLDEVLGLVRGSFEQKQVAVEVADARAPLFVRGQRAQLGQGLAQLLASLRAAATEGSRVAIAGGVAEGRVTLAFTLTDAPRSGHADDWMASGMGFWVANRVFADHDGQLIEPTADGASGARTWRVVLPEA
jgi:signal transduction histidine kinase